MVEGIEVIRVDTGASDPRGHAFVTWHTRGRDASGQMFDEALDRHRVKLVYLRELNGNPNPGDWRVRFTAYDDKDEDVTLAVCGAHVP